MKYAFSTPSKYSQITGTTSKADARDKFIAAFVAAGWTVSSTFSRNTPVVGSVGTRLLGASPEGYTVYLDIFIESLDQAVLFQLNSAAGSGAAGNVIGVFWQAVFTWQLLLHPCGAFISMPGVDSLLQGSVVVLGIPFIGANCGVTGTPTTECWFNFCDTDGSIFVNSNPRLNIDIGNRHDRSNQGCYNGSLSVLSSLNAWNGSEILRFSAAAPDDLFAASRDSRPLWYGEQDFLYPAFIAWPDAENQPIKIRGQIYNAAVRSSQSSMDQLRTWDGYDWLSFTHNHYWGTLWLFVKNSSGLSNVAY